MRKLTCLLLAAALCVGMLSGCGEKTEEKPQVTLTIKTPTLTMPNFFDSEVNSSKEFLDKAATDFSAWYDKADVTINVTEFEQVNEIVAVADSLGTEEAPDVLYEGYFNMASYIHTGYVVPLDDIISDELRGDISDSLWENSTLNGKTYMMPYLGLTNVLTYNKELFRQCGLDRYISDEDEVQTWSVEEWSEILDTLAEKLPDGRYPLMMYAANNQGDTHVMTFLRMFGSEFFTQDGHFNLNTEEGIAALRWLKEGHEKGYFPANCEQMEMNDNLGLFRNGQLAMYLYNTAHADIFADMDLGYVNFPSVKGDGFNTTFVTGFEVYDNGDPEKLAVAKDFVKYIYESDYINYQAGGLPANNSVAEKYRDELADAQKFVDVVDRGFNFTGNNPNWGGVREVFYTHIQSLFYGTETPEQAAEGLDRDCNAAIDEGYAGSRLHE